MATPVNGDWDPVKRIARYLLGRTRVAHLFRWQAQPTHIDVFAGSNGAGCTKTRKSTTGFCVVHGGHLIRSLSRTQSNIALSRAEAELYAMTTGASEGLGVKAMCSEFGVGVSVFLHVDASAAIGVAGRKGLGRIRHLETQSLWIQDAVRERRVSLCKIKDTENQQTL